MPRTITITCECCGLHANVPDADGGKRATMCGRCYEHRGVNPEMQIRRHSDHEQMLRERLKAASDWAAGAERDKEDAFFRMKSALLSRDRAVEYLQRINDIHALDLQGACKCGKRSGCSVGKILDEKWARQMIGRKDRNDDRGDPYDR